MHTPDIVIDGFSDVKQANGFALCIDQANVSFANLNIPENLDNILTDISRYNCQTGNVASLPFQFPGKLLQ
ncbi:MAG: hypothetical protein IPO92_17190 [Saprospiraceae bacterium]|nr:hypothetical protein [Saprospiraceae bacterium]